MALSKKQREELETKITKVFKISTDPSPEVLVILDKINPAIKSGDWSYNESVSLLFCEKDGTRVGSGSISMTTTKFYKKYLNQEVK
jgi:hypothetical protein